MRLLDPGAAGQRPRPAPPDAVHVALAGTEAARSWLAAEHANLLACADHAAEHGPPAYTSTLSAILGPHLMNVGHYLDALTLHAGALRAVGTDDSGRADALDSMGVIYLKLGRYPEAADHHERALALLARIGDRIGEARSLNQLGNIHLWTGRYAEAVDRYRQALAVQRNIGDRAGQTRTLGNLGAAYQRLHRFAEAVDHLEQAHVLAREFGDRIGEANAVGNLGIVYGKMRRFADAVDQHRRALRIQEEIGDQTGKIRTLTNLGDACVLAGRFQEAVDHSEQACAMARETPRLRILLSKVVRFRPKRAAAPAAPPTTQLVSRNAFRMWSRSASASVTGSIGNAMFDGKGGSRSTSPLVSITARSMKFCSSRILPCHG